MKSLVENAHNIVIFTHMAPDGDAMGSSLALWHWVNSLTGTESAGLTAKRSVSETVCQAEGRSVQVIVPNAFPAFFNWMPGASDILIYEKCAERCNTLIAQADLFICTDFNDPKRIGPMGDKMMENPCPKILIDHHLNPVDFADEVHSDPSACSSCEIVYRILTGEASLSGTESAGLSVNEANGLSAQRSVSSKSGLTCEIATAIYTGLMTDTGNFSFNSTRCEIYEIIAELVRAGIKKDEIYNAVFNQYSVDRVRLTGYALYRKMRIYPEHHLALITLSADELDRYHYQVGDTEGLVNMPLQISDVYYSVFMREERPKPGTPKPRIRVSFRSQGDRPVNIWANEVFHGGGHANASGGELFGSLEQAVRLFEQSFPKYITPTK